MSSQNTNMCFQSQSRWFYLEEILEKGKGRQCLALTLHTTTRRNLSRDDTVSHAFQCSDRSYEDLYTSENSGHLIQAEILN